MSTTPATPHERVPAIEMISSPPAWRRTAALIFALLTPLFLILVLALPAVVLPALSLLVIAVMLGLRRGRIDEPSVVLEADGILVEARKRRRIARKDVATAYDDPQRKLVVLETSNGARFELVVSGANNRRRILEHLGQTLDQRALVAPLRGNLGAFTRGLIAFAVTACIGVPVLAGIVGAIFGSTATDLVRIIVGAAPFFSAAVSALVVVRIGHPRVVVGVDGVRLLGRFVPRFVPYEKINAVETNAYFNGLHGLVVVLASGERIFLPTVAQSEGQVHALRARIEDGLRRHREAERGPALENFGRAGRSVKVWREELVRQAKGGGFRVATIEPGVLEDVVKDPAAPLDRRVGAALALREISPDAGARVRIAAARVADENVRVALEEAASDEVDEDRLEKALVRALET